MRRRRFLLALLAGVVLGCGPSTGLYHERIYVFGTLVDVSLWGVTEEQGRRAVADFDRTFQTQHFEWHAWKPGALTDLNGAIARGEPGRATPHLVRLIEISSRLAAQSDDLFNPALGHLIRLWGFHNDELPAGPPPARSEIEAWVAKRPRMGDVTVEGGLVALVQPGGHARLRRDREGLRGGPGRRAAAHARHPQRAGQRRRRHDGHRPACRPALAGCGARTPSAPGLSWPASP